MLIFNIITSADFVLISADVILKMTKILNQLRITQMCSKNGRTFVKVSLMILVISGNYFQTKVPRAVQPTMTFVYILGLVER